MIGEEIFLEKRTEKIEASSDNNNYIVIDLKPRSRVVTFKIEADTLKTFDKYVESLGIRNRSMVIKKLITAFIEGMKKFGNLKQGEFELVFVLRSKNNSDKKNMKEISIELRT